MFTVEFDDAINVISSLNKKLNKKKCYFITLTGLSPYPGLELTEIKDRILSGERLTHPIHCSTDL